jgi:hypothetical protein
MKVMKPVDLGLLHQELLQAGAPFRVLTMRTTPDGGTEIWDQNPIDGSDLELPPAAAAVLAAHIAPVLGNPDYGAEGRPDVLSRQAVQIVQQLRAYLDLGTNGNPAPTTAQTIAVIKLLIRVVLVIVKTQIATPAPPVQS